MTFALAEASPNALPIVSRIVDDGPAARAGIKLQDKLVSVDGQRVGSWSLAKVQRSIIDGDPGSFVQLELHRGISGRRVTVVLQRGNLEVMQPPSVQSGMIEEKILKDSFDSARKSEDLLAQIHELSTTCTRLKVRMISSLFSALCSTPLMRLNLMLINLNTLLQLESEKWAKKYSKEEERYEGLRKELERSLARSQALEDGVRSAAAREKDYEVRHASMQAKLSGKEEEIREMNRRMKDSMESVKKDAEHRVEKQQQELEVWKKEAQQERDRRKTVEESMETERGRCTEMQNELDQAQANAAQLEAQCRVLQGDAAQIIAAISGMPCYT